MNQTEQVEPAFDAGIAHAEGWGLFTKDDRTVIERLDVIERDDRVVGPVFSSDAAAIAHVTGLAKNGSVYHRKALAETARNRYLIGEWEHIPSGAKRPKVFRLCFDRDEHRMVSMQVKGPGGVWAVAQRDDVSDVAQSLLNANDNVFDNPAGYGMTVGDAPPEWAGSPSTQRGGH